MLYSEIDKAIEIVNALEHRQVGRALAIKKDATHPHRTCGGDIGRQIVDKDALARSYIQGARGCQVGAGIGFSDT